MESSDDTSGLISIDTFLQVDLRVGQIVKAERVPNADKLLRLEVDLAEPGGAARQLLAGIAEWYAPESLLGQKIIVVSNLQPRRMRGDPIARSGRALMIHGHTHRPARHDHVVDGKACVRWVLPDWYESGGYLEATPSGVRAVALA